MQYRKLGNTDIDVSTVCFGCWAIIGGFNWGPQDKQDSLAALQAAYDCGITFFDTAEGYGAGASEQLVAEALGAHRDELVIASKVSPSHFESAALREACDRSLKNLNTDRIDLYQLHWPKHDLPVEETIAVLDELKAAGKIREYGVSNFGVQDMGEVCAKGLAVASNQLAYNLLFRALEFGVQPLCVEHGVSILCYSSIMQGLLTGKFATVDSVPLDRARTRHFSGERRDARHGESGQEELTFAAVDRIREIADEAAIPMVDLALAWLLTRPAVTSVIVSGRNPDQTQQNAAAADVVLCDETIAHLDEATDALKQALGPNVDMWQGGAKSRTR